MSAVSTSSAEEVEVEVEVAAPPALSESDDRAFAAAPPPPPIPPIGLSGSQPVQSLTGRDCAGEEEVEGTAEQSKEEGKKQKTILTSATPRAASAA